MDTKALESLGVPGATNMDDEGAKLNDDKRVLKPGVGLKPCPGLKPSETPYPASDLFPAPEGLYPGAPTTDGEGVALHTD